MQKEKERKKMCGALHTLEEGFTYVCVRDTKSSRRAR